MILPGRQRSYRYPVITLEGAPEKDQHIRHLLREYYARIYDALVNAHRLLLRSKTNPSPRPRYPGKCIFAQFILMALADRLILIWF